MPASSAPRRHLPIVAGSLRADGSRATVHTADVRGRFHRARHLVFWILIAIWIALPQVTIGGRPAVFLDVPARQFFLLGGTFNAQDIWLVFFLVTGVGFGLVVVTALAGRAFCGWACPQTVFLDAIFRPLERWVMGSREVRMRAAKSAMTFARAARLALLHALYLLAAFAVSHVFLAYFASVRGAWAMMRGSPAAHPEAFAWMMALTAILYGNFAFFREQLCLIVCPYGRLQSVLLDTHSLVVGYDERRGEPRGKATDTGAGDCVDCKRCVVVCPTGIDIRDGLQLDCVACTACIDACDEVMDRLKRPRGLVRYDSLDGLAGKPRKILRPRLVLYAALLAVGVTVAGVSVASRQSFEANLLRPPGAPYVLDGDTVRNVFQLHLVNKRAEPVVFEIRAEQAGGVTFLAPVSEVRLDGLASQRVPLVAAMPAAAFERDVPLRVRVRAQGSTEEHVVSATFLGARGPR